MTCGKPVGHLWERYKAQVDKGADPKAVLDSLGLERYCCRGLLISHLDIVERVGRFNKLAPANEKVEKKEEGTGKKRKSKGK
jgi:DNA-directed RNA polymerase subunit N